MNGPQPIKNVNDFWQDTTDCWQRLPNKTFFFVLLAAWLALFQFLGNSILGYVHTPSLFLWMYHAYNGSASAQDDKHGNIIPFLVIGLFWWKRHELLNSRMRFWGPGLAILIFGMVLQILGYSIQVPQVSIVALFVGIYGLMGLAWGTEWLFKSLFPFFLFAFSIPLGTHSTFITFPLRLLVTWLVEGVSHIFGIGVIRVGTSLIDPSGTFRYDVVAACSGIRSLVAIFLLATVYAFFTFRSPWKRLFLIALACPFAVLANMLRLLMVIVAAEIGGQTVGDWVHDDWFTSILPYVPAFIGFMLVGQWLEKQEKRAGETGLVSERFDRPLKDTPTNPHGASPESEPT
ncbi:MAG TPA: exosortase/archaeosortase family protein [Verrucomicrobiae bacterium]|jgi:exosortase